MEDNNRKKELEIFLNSMKFEYRNLFKEELGVGEIVYFCDLGLHLDKDKENKDNFEKLFSKLYTEGKIADRKKDSKHDYLNRKYSNELSESDLRYIFYSYLLPYGDMVYFNDELNKPYVNLDCLIYFVCSKYGVSYNEVCNRLNEVSSINSSRVLSK